MPLQIKTFSLLLLQKMQNNIILSTFSPFTSFSIFCPATHYRGCFFRLYCKVNQHTMNKAYGKIVSNFSIDGSVKSIEPLGNGLINDTFKVPAMKYVKEYGGKAEAAISYTKSPVHSEDYFVKLAMQLEKMGADTICIKDMANLLLPYDAYSLVKKLKENVSVPIHLHTHNTTGTGDMVNLMAAQAGVDIVEDRKSVV